MTRADGTTTKSCGRIVRRTTLSDYVDGFARYINCAPRCFAMLLKTGPLSGWCWVRVEFGGWEGSFWSGRCIMCAACDDNVIYSGEFDREIYLWKFFIFRTIWKKVISFWKSYNMGIYYYFWEKYWNDFVEYF